MNNFLNVKVLGLEIVKLERSQHVNERSTNVQRVFSQSSTKSQPIREEKKREEFTNRNYKPDFDKLFIKIKARIHQGWITEVFEQRKKDSGNCEKTITEYMEKTLKQSLYEFCYSSKIYGLNFYGETACINYWKMASKGYICDVDTWRKLLKAAKLRAEDKVSNSY